MPKKGPPEQVRISRRISRRSAALRLVHNQLSAADQSLLIGQGDSLARPDGRERRPQAHHTHHGGDHSIRLGHSGRFLQGGKAPQHPHRRIRQAYRQIPGGGLVGHNRQTRRKPPRLLLYPLNAGMGGNGRHLQPQLLHHVQRLPADGARGAQYGNHIRHKLILSHKLQNNLNKGRDKQHAVKPVQHTAVLQKEMSIILDAEFPLDEGKTQVADLRHHTAHQAQ